MAKREERSTAIPWLGEPGEQGEALEGLYVAGDAGRGGAVIAPPHPLYGGSMESPVVTELAWACTKAGLASLRFNWRGVGGSTGAPSGALADGVEDFAAALLQLGRGGPGPLVAAGYSFGAAAAVLAAADQPRVMHLVLVAPPPALLAAERLDAGERQVLLLAGRHDTIAPPAALEAIAKERVGVRFVLLEDADHFFAAGLAALGAEVASWLGR